MEDLYVIEQGCVVKKEDIQFSIHKNGEKLVSIPSYKVEKVLLFGNQQITTQAVSMTLEKNIDVLFLTANGSIKGMASKIYFEKIKPIIPSPFEFNGRNRRPPKDEVNALLSLTYTMFLNHLITEIEKLGFDSYIGFIYGII